MRTANFICLPSFFWMIAMSPWTFSQFASGMQTTQLGILSVRLRMSGNDRSWALQPVRCEDCGLRTGLVVNAALAL